MSSILLPVKGFERFGRYIIKIYGPRRDPRVWHISKMDNLSIPALYKARRIRFKKLNSIQEIVRGCLSLRKFERCPPFLYSLLCLFQALRIRY